MAVVIVGLVIADFMIGLDVCFFVAVLVLGLCALGEFYTMCESRRTGPFRWWGLFCLALLTILHWASLPGTFEWFRDRLGATWLFRAPVAGDDLVLLGMVVAVLGALQLQSQKRDNDRVFESISSTLFGLLYVWFLSSFLVKLRHMGADGVLGGRDWNLTGSGLLVSCLVASKLADVGGYLVGRKIGRTRMIPRISPNKTYEGLVAGLALSVAATLLMWRFGFLPLGPWWQALLFALVAGGLGVLGDLAESLLKRGSGVKDAGAVVPGFGGVLDVIDSVLVSGTVVYFLCLVLLRVGAA